MQHVDLHHLDDVLDHVRALQHRQPVEQREPAVVLTRPGDLPREDGRPQRERDGNAEPQRPALQHSHRRGDHRPGQRKLQVPA